MRRKAVDSHRGFHLFQGIRQTPQQNPQVTHVDLAMDSLWICHGIMAKFSGGNSPPCLDLPKRRILNSVHKQIKNMKILSVHTQKNKKTKYWTRMLLAKLTFLYKNKNSGEFKPAPNILCPLTYDLFAVCVTLKNIGLLGNKAIHPYKKNKKH